MKGGVPFWGIRFHNGKDNVDQGAKGDGKSAIIIGGEMTPRKAQALQHKLEEVTGGTGDPEDLDMEGIKAILAYAADELGLNDMWNSKLSSVADKSRPVDDRIIAPSDSNNLKQYTGYFENRPERQTGVVAVRVKGPASFHGDVAGGKQDYSEARGFYVTIGVRDGLSQYRGVAEEAFLRDYVDCAGGKPHPNDLVTVNAKTLHVLQMPASMRLCGGMERTSP
jgi:hypothetical protein